MLTTFYLAKNDRRWVTFITLKTISLASAPPEAGGAQLAELRAEIASGDLFPVPFEAYDE